MSQTQRASILSILFMGLSLTGQVTLAHAGTVSQPIQKDHHSGPQPVTASLLNLPIQFEANQGQVDQQVKFLARGKGYNLFLTPTESVMVLTGRDASSMKSEAGSDPTDVLDHKSQKFKHSVVRMKLEGANPSPAIDGMEQLPGIVNYFIGNDPAKWRTKIPTYAKVHYKEAYPGIDLAYYGNQGQLEYDFIVSPGADPNQIKLAFEGASEITVADSGDLVLTTALGDVRVQKPIVYQLENDGHKTLVAGNYVIDIASDRSLIASSHLLSHSVGIQLAAYDRKRPVVIDPVLLYSTYLGGGAGELAPGDGAAGIAVDASENVYIAAGTNTTDWPGATGSGIQHTLGGGGDAVVTKLNPTGSAIVYSTYLGGTGNDGARSIAVDNSGNAYVVGQANSVNFPVTAGSFQQSKGGGAFDAFVTKINPSGTALIYSSFLGGSSDENANGRGSSSIAVDASGNAYVTGVTFSTNFPGASTSGIQPTFGGASDGFLVKVNPSGSALLYSTYLGGGGSDEASSVAIDGIGNAYVAGFTNSSNFPGTSSSVVQPTVGGGFDGFLLRINPLGTVRDFATYLVDCNV